MIGCVKKITTTVMMMSGITALTAQRNMKKIHLCTEAVYIIKRIEAFLVTECNKVFLGE
jgi:hypothetical protein